MRRSHDWTLCRSGLFDVAELSRCSADGRREVVQTILMFTWRTQVRPPGSRGRSRSRRSPGCRRSSRSRSEQSCQNALQNPDCLLSRAGPSASRGSGGLLSLELCAQKNVRSAVPRTTNDHQEVDEVVVLVVGM